jgi:hypothetical protein
MTLVETRRYEMLARVREFGLAYRDKFPESSLGGQTFALVAEAVHELAQNAMSKMSHAKSGRGSRIMARAALENRLDALGRTARAIAEDIPGFDDPFQLPRRLSEQALLTTGRMFVHDAETASQQFIAHGMPETFIADLTALVDRFEQAVRTRENNHSEKAQAQASISAALLSGLSAVRKLDVIVANQLGEDPAAIARWEVDRRMDYRRRGRKDAAAAAPAGTTPAATPAAAEPANASKPAPAPTVSTEPAPGGGEPATPDALKVAS